MEGEGEVVTCPGVGAGVGAPGHPLLPALPADPLVAGGDGGGAQGQLPGGGGGAGGVGGGELLPRGDRGAGRGLVLDKPAGVFGFVGIGQLDRQ